MAKLAEKIKTAKGLKLKVVNPDAAGIDISPKELQVCVPSDRDEQNNRVFGVYTKNLHEISDWLKKIYLCGKKTLYMHPPVFE